MSMFCVYMYIVMHPHPSLLNPSRLEIPTLVGGQGSFDDLPEEERALVDQLFEEVRFPLISTSFLCQGTPAWLSLALGYT